MAKQQIPATVLEALKSGYRIIRQTSKQVAKGRCAGTVHLENGSRPGLVNRMISSSGTIASLRTLPLWTGRLVRGGIWRESSPRLSAQ